MKTIILALSFLYFSQALAEEPDCAKYDYLALLTYSPIDLLIPSKIGASFGYMESADKIWEFEYLRGSLSAPFVVGDLGKMTDERVSVMKRSYSGSNSFNFSYGITYYNFSLRLGSDILSRVSGGQGAMDMIQIQSLGVNLGLGHRWSIAKNITAGVDWVSWSQPLLTLKKDAAFLDQANDANDKDDVDKAVKLITYFPRFVFLKLQVGVLF